MTSINDLKALLKAMGFVLRDGSEGTWIKSYPNHSKYQVKVDVAAMKVDYGSKIHAHNKSTLSFKDAETLVVLECVNRLLDKGYQPSNIHLETTWPTGHNTSGRLDILVKRNNGKTYMMIECKTHGPEFEKALGKLNKNGGQLFTYFQQDKDAELLVLYTSRLEKNKIQSINRIVRIDEDYRQTATVKDLFERWSKLVSTNGVFEDGVNPYNYQSKALTPKDLKEIAQADSSFIFNRFLEILRHNVVSDKPNAFNKIFTLFLCKIYDEKVTKDHNELAFQWFYTPHQYEGLSYEADDNISFQKRLTDLYRKGMLEFLDKEVTDISDAEFEKKYSTLNGTLRRQIMDEFTEIRLKKNNEFAIKEVFNDDSFEENAKVVKEVVELLQGFKIRYAKKQQYLSDFFELLLTTGLKQESGQFFTPVPIAQFIIKSIPIDKLVAEKLEKGEKDNLLPRIIDYAAGSGHFLTESMHEVQRILNDLDTDSYVGSTVSKIESWRKEHFEWANQYVYGIEKDYRLVKVGKVGCYLHGDGLAQIIHSDGLGNFKNTAEYKNLLKKSDKNNPQENRQFDIVASNPPYSVNAFRNNARKYYNENDFELYSKLTDQSDEIECLFVERTKQLLKDGGVAGIILPSSILSNTGIYTKTREMILAYFEIVAIAELGSGTFMATGTNTVTLFLRRRNNYDAANIQALAKEAISTQKDITINGIEKALSQYIDHVWDGITLKDYISLLLLQPNEAIKKHELYKDYLSKSFEPRDILECEQDKLYYFTLVYSQKIVLVKSLDKKIEKAFLGYEFSFARNDEGIHPIKRGKNAEGREYTIDDWTKLFDPERFDNPVKASTYVYKAFQGDYTTPIDPSIAAHVSRMNLVDMIRFDRADFPKTISLSVKKKVKSKWPSEKLGTVCDVQIGATPSRSNYAFYENGVHPWVSISEMNGNIITDTNEKLSDLGIEKSSVKKIVKNTTLLSFKLSIGKVAIAGKDLYTNEAIAGLSIRKEYEDLLFNKYLFILFKQRLIDMDKGGLNAFGQSLNKTFLNEEIRIPLMPVDKQKELIARYEQLEKTESQMLANKKLLKSEIAKAFSLSKNEVPLRQWLITVNPSKSDYIDGLPDETEVGFLTMSDVSNDAKIETLQKRSLSEVKKAFTFFQEGDVLLAKITPCMENGKGALVEELPNNLGFGSTEFFVLRPDTNKVLPKVLFYLTKTEEFRGKMEAEMTGASGHRRVPKTEVESYPVPNFTKEEQEKILSIIEEVENKEMEIEQQLTQIDEQKTALVTEFLV